VTYFHKRERLRRVGRHTDKWSSGGGPQAKNYRYTALEHHLQYRHVMVGYSAKPNRGALEPYSAIGNTDTSWWLTAPPSVQAHHDGSQRHLQYRHIMMAYSATFSTDTSWWLTAPPSVQAHHDGSQRNLQYRHIMLAPLSAVVSSPKSTSRIFSEFNFLKWPNREAAKMRILIFLCPSAFPHTIVR